MGIANEGYGGKVGREHASHPFLPNLSCLEQVMPVPERRESLHRFSASSSSAYREPLLESQLSKSSRPPGLGNEFQTQPVRRGHLELGPDLLSLPTASSPGCAVSS